MGDCYQRSTSVQVSRWKVLHQVDNFSCGYHALKNALLMLKRADQNFFVDKNHFWDFFHECLAILRGLPLPDKELISDGVLEASFASALLAHHPELRHYASSGELSLFPTLACLESGLLSEDEVSSLVSRIKRFQESHEARHVWVIGSSANHWVALLAEKQSNSEVCFSLADPAITERAIHPDAVNLMQCLHGELSFEAMYLEAMVRGTIKEFQEVAIQCYTCSSGSGLTNENVTLRQLISQLADNIQTQYPLCAPSHRIDSLMSDLNHFIFVQRKNSSHPFDVLARESFLRFRENLQANIKWNQNTYRLWSFVEEPTYGDAIALRNSLSSHQELSLWNYQLPSLPNLVCSLNSLRVLNLNQNCLATLPQSLFRLPQLELISACSNKLTQLPEITTANTSLRELLLSNNLLETLPISIVNLVALRSLNLDSNRLEKVDALPVNLLSLVLSYNRLKHITATETLQNLEALLIDHNNVESVRLSNCTSVLQVFWVQGNPKSDSISVAATGYLKR